MRMDAVTSLWTARRSTADRKVAGVAGGVARAWNVDPVLVRVGFAVLALSGGIGLVLYLAGWLMMPADDAPVSLLERAVPQTRGWSREVRIGLVVLACLVGVAALSWLVPFSSSAAVVMAAVWYFGYYRNRPRRPDHHHDPAAVAAPQPRFARFAGAPTPFTEAATAWQQRIGDYERMEAARTVTGSWAAPTGWSAAGSPSARSAAHGSATGFPTDGWSAAPDRARARAAYLAHPDPVGLYAGPAPDESAVRRAGERRMLRRRSARRLGLAGLAGVGLALTGLAVAASLGAVVPASAYFATALLLVGLTLLLGTRFGRPRGAVPAAVLLTAAMAFGLVSERVPAIAGEIGTQDHVYSSQQMLPAAPQQLLAGRMTVDLSRLAVTSPRTYTARVDTGELVLTLPRSVPVTVVYSVGQGEAVVAGRGTRHGQHLTGTITSRGPGPGLTIHLRVDRGLLEVRR